MLEAAWLFIGFVALCSTGVALSTKTKLAGAYGDDDSIAIFAGIVGFICWGYWSYGALNLETVTETGEVVSTGMPEVTILGIALAIVPGFIALTGPADIIRRARKPEASDL